MAMPARTLLLTSIASAVVAAALAGCVPVAVTPGVVLDDAAAAAYVAGRTQQAEATQAAATSTADAMLGQWTQAAATRTEQAAVTRQALQAGADNATAYALTPTLTPVPSATPAPTSTPRPTWTATPDATVAALKQQTAQIERDNAFWRGLIGNLFLVAVLIGAAAGVVYLIARLVASALFHLAQSWRETLYVSGDEIYDLATREWVKVKAPMNELPTPAAPQDDSIDYVADWQRGYWMFARWLQILPEAERTRKAMAGIVSEHGWNVYMAGLRQMPGALGKDGKVYRLELSPEEVRRACADVIPPFNRTSPTYAPAVRPVDAAYRSTGATVGTPTGAATA